LDEDPTPGSDRGRGLVDDQEETHTLSFAVASSGFATTVGKAAVAARHRTRAYDPAVAKGAHALDALAELTAEIVTCRACPRLVEWREQVAREKRAAFRDEDYWGRPVPGFGDPRARVLIVGLAPAAHGGNRTGRIFTGDRSGDWLFGALHRTGYANQATSVRAGDGLKLHDAYVAAAVRCAPPANKPAPEERDRCLPYLVRELALLERVRVIVVLGQFAYDATARVLAASGSPLPSPRPRFGHGVVVPSERAVVVGCFHPSQQNTFTGKLTEPMLDDVFVRARALSTRPRA
jgi:uracil-DNA glycosylase